MAKESDLVLMPSCYGLDDLEAQVEAAYELEENGIGRDRIWFVFSRTSGSPAEDLAAREYLQRAKINFFEPILPELPCIRQGHNGGKAASEISFPVIRERAIALAVAVASQVQVLKAKEAT
jgi:chromosome partitioning protein